MYLKVMLPMLDGLLIIDKPHGMTSHDVVNVVRRLTGISKVGHAGTLDPEATGVLVVCVGKATKFVRFFEALEKTYWTVLHLGICTDTQDASGTILRQVSVPTLSPSHLQQVLAQFTGRIKQIPPMYSAVKYHGRRLYQLARQGQTVLRQPREITIHRLELLDLRGVRVTLAVQCSKGTYIRSLGEDIGLALGYGGHIERLQRCRVGTFSLHRAYSLEFLQKQAKEGRLGNLVVPIARALEFLPVVSITPCQFRTLSQKGRTVSLTLNTLNALLPHHCTKASSYRLCMQPEQTVAVVQRQSTDETWKMLLLE
jgi:tRNA pseudouridine55 synthase